MIRAMVMNSYDWFVDLVVDRRKLPRDEVLRLANGAIFTGRQALDVKLVDALGGEDTIRTYLKGRGVADTLAVVDWKAPSSGSMFGLGSIISTVIHVLGYGDFMPSATLSSATSDKLFLDGLISVWQVGRD